METLESKSNSAARTWGVFFGGMLIGALVWAGASQLTRKPEESASDDKAARWETVAESPSAAGAAAGKGEGDSTPREEGVPTGTTPDDSLGSEVERGRELARQICSGCHLYPEPQLLDKVNWAFEVLPDMGIIMGMEEGDPYVLLGAQQRVREAGIIPTEPVLQSVEDWRAIIAFYLHEAPDEALPQPPRSPIEIGLDQFESVIPAQVQIPQTSLVRIDAAGRRLFVGEAETNTFAIFGPDLQRQRYLNLASPPSDMELKGDAMYVLQIGDLLPSDELNGSLAVIGKPGSNLPGGGGTILARMPRPVDMEIVDLNGDGRDDIVVCGYGNHLGSLLWYENTEEGGYKEHVIENRPGAIKVYPRDYNKDGRMDLIVMFAQYKEGIYLFENAGNGDFLMTPLMEKHPIWGNSYFELADMDGDGDEDILATNGDNGDHTQLVPPFKNYHGVRIYLNDGRFNFTESWFYPINGAYKAMARDYDQDGDLDIASIAYFADYRRSREETFVYFENQGDMTFTTRTFEQTLAGRWLTMDAGDLDGDGDIDLVLGALNEGPSVVPAVLQQRWVESGPPFLLLKNTLKSP